MTESRLDPAGSFHKIPRLDDVRLAEIFARGVLAMLVFRELLSPAAFFPRIIEDKLQRIPSKGWAEMIR